MSRGPEGPAGFRGVFRSDDEARAVYSEAAGIARIAPLAVAVPADAGDVSALAAWARTTGTPLVPRGSGSGMASGAIGPGVIVDLSRLDAIEPIEPGARSVRVGPGAICARLNEVAGRRGLRLPVAPSSAPFCTIGGMAATNAAGAHSLLHGAMRPWVTALDCVFDDGTRATVRRGAPPPGEVPAIARFLRGAAALRDAERATPSVHAGVRKDSSGYALAAWAESGELVDLLVGSEGTLAMFVGVEVALASLPRATSSLLGVFPSLEAAVSAAIRAREAGAAACELLDRTFLEIAAESGSEVPLDAEAVLLAEVEAGDDAEAAARGRALAEVFGDAGATETRLALDAASAHALWALRHAASPTLARLAPALRSMQVIEDGAVPPGRLPEYVRGVRAALGRRGMRGVIFGHAGDGHVHVNPLVDVRGEGWRETLLALLDEVTGLVTALGGTVAGEHGDGRLRAPLLDRCWSASARARFAAVKDAFDPAGILNPGAKLARAGEEPLAWDVKYDPALPPLPSAARRALDRVERTRAYAADRLALLAEAAEPSAAAAATPED